jgi:hypothetical protein
MQYILVNSTRCTIVYGIFGVRAFMQEGESKAYIDAVKKTKIAQKFWDAEKENYKPASK